MILCLISPLNFQAYVLHSSQQLPQLTVIQPLLPMLPLSVTLYSHVPSQQVINSHFLCICYLLVWKLCLSVCLWWKILSGSRVQALSIIFEEFCCCWCVKDLFWNVLSLLRIKMMIHNYADLFVIFIPVLEEGRQSSSLLNLSKCC